MSEHKLSVERIKHLLERAKICEQGDVEDVCDTALALAEELESCKQAGASERKAQGDTIVQLRAEVDRLKRYERLWSAIPQDIAFMGIGWKEEIENAYEIKLYAVPQDEKKVCPPKKDCPDCEGTGWCGDNGPGIKGNSEYNRCDCTIPQGEKKEGDDDKV